MGATFSRIKNWINGETLTHSDLNAEYDNILNNFDPDGLDDASTNATAMQATADPYPGDTESLATSLRGEIQRLRYVLKQITGEAQWYIDPDVDLATIASSYATRAGIQAGAYLYAIVSGTDTYTATLSPAPAEYTQGMVVHLLFSNANTSTTPTINLNGLGAKTIVRHLIYGDPNAELYQGDIKEAHRATLLYNGTQFVLLNPAFVGPHDHVSAREGGVLTAPALPDGAVVQVQTYQTGAVATGTTVMPDDDTIPQNTEGDPYMELPITPKSTTNKLVIEVACGMACSADRTMSGAIFQDATAGALAAAKIGGTVNGTPNNMMPFYVKHTMTAGTISATTFKFRAGPGAAGTITFNGQSGARLYGGVSASSITITEVKAS